MTSFKNITELRDNSVRHALILRYLEVETSFEEEHLLADYYRQAREEKLTKEDISIRAILLGISNNEENTLSDSAVTEFDRIIADSQTQCMSSKQIKQPQETIKHIRVSAILLAAAMLAGLIFLVLPQRQQKNLELFSQPSSKIVCQNTETGLTIQEAWEREDSIFLANELSQKNTKTSYKEASANALPHEEKAFTISTNKERERTISSQDEQKKEPNALELFDKCSEIASLLIPTTEQVGVEYDGDNSILTITDGNGATYQYKIQTDKDNREDYQLSPLANIRPADIGLN